MSEWTQHQSKSIAEAYWNKHARNDEGHEEFVSPYKPILRVGTGIEKSTNVVDLTKLMPLGTESVLEKLSPSNTPILTVKGALEDVWASPSKAKSFVPKRPNKPILIMQGAHIPPVFIRPVSQLPMTNPKAQSCSLELWAYCLDIQGKKLMKKLMK